MSTPPTLQLEYGTLCLFSLPEYRIQDSIAACLEVCPRSGTTIPVGVRSTVRRLINLAILVFDLSTCTSYMFRAPAEQTLEIGAFPSTVRLYGAVCQLTCGQPDT